MLRTSAQDLCFTTALIVDQRDTEFLHLYTGATGLLLACYEVLLHGMGDGGSMQELLADSSMPPAESSTVLCTGVEQQVLMTFL